MKKLMIVLIAVCFTQCKTIKNEITNYKVNKSIIKKTFPDSYAEPVTGYNDVFTVSNTEFVCKVRLRNNSIIQLDTLKTFNTVVARN